MIQRIWHGYTTADNADRYEALLRERIFPGIAAKNVTGYRGVRLLRADKGDEVEFITVMSFDSWDAVRDFAGEDFEVAYVPQEARAVLARWDERSRHYEVRASLTY